MNCKPLTIEIVTPQFYKHVFNISYASAKRWYNEDCETLGRRRLTLPQFQFLYTSVEPLKPQEIEQSLRRSVTAKKAKKG